MLKAGTLIDGHYRILREIGHGGMSIVYLASDTYTQILYAIKAVKPVHSGTSDTQCASGVQTETAILQTLEHPSLPKFIEHIEIEGSFLIVMAFIEGQSLKSWLAAEAKAGRKVPINRFLEIADQVCDVLAYLHTLPEPVIHGDLKPSNVMLQPDGQIVLIDFGSACFLKNQAAEKNVQMGTPGFAAPEQYDISGRIGPWTDIYAWGALVQVMLTETRHGKRDLDFPDLVFLLAKCRQTSVEKRYQSVGILRQDLHQVQQIAADRKRRRRRQRIWSQRVMALIPILIISVWLMLTQYSAYMRKARYEALFISAATADTALRIDLMQEAIAMWPTCERAYLALLDILTADHVFSDEDESCLMRILYAQGEAAQTDYRKLLAQNESGYIYFAYRMGEAYFYLAEGTGAKAKAGTWFDIVNQADLSRFDFTHADKERPYWQTYAQILGRICHYDTDYSNLSRNSEEGVDYRGYWADLNHLLDIDFLTDAVVKLRLYQAILTEVYDHMADFYVSGTVSFAQMQALMDSLTQKIEANGTDADTMAGRLRESAKTALEQTGKYMTVIYARDWDRRE